MYNHTSPPQGVPCGLTSELSPELRARAARTVVSRRRRVVLSVLLVCISVVFVYSRYISSIANTWHSPKICLFFLNHSKIAPRRVRGHISKPC